MMPVPEPTAPDPRSRAPYEVAESLYVEMAPQMLRLATRALPPGSGLEDAEDLVQGVFVEFLRMQAANPQLVVGHGWFMRRLRSRLVDYYRRRQREQAQQTSLAAAYVSPAADDHFERVVELSNVFDAISDSTDRATLGLRLLGLSESEIATRLNLPGRWSARRRMDRVRRQLRSIRPRVTTHLPASTPHHMAKATKSD